MSERGVNFSDNLLRLVDKTVLYKDLLSITDKSSKCFDLNVRAELVDYLKTTITNGRQRAERILLRDGHGHKCARRLCLMCDDIINVLYALANEHICPNRNLATDERLALVAVGGYGRATLGPRSDIDLHFLLSRQQTPRSEQIIEYVLHTLWDVGLKVGHATRTVSDELRMANDDITVCSALLDARFIAGDCELFGELTSRFDNEIIRKRKRFMQAKLAERDLRQSCIGQSRYLVEPNVKEGKGGQRDLHTLRAIARYYFGIKKMDELVPSEILTRDELQAFKKADDFLWTVRCHMHFLSGNENEILSFDIQRDIAHRLGYRAHSGLKDVERFMKHYFLVAKRVGDLTRVILAALEETFTSNRQCAQVNPSARARVIDEAPDLIIDNGRINTSDDYVFRRDPLNLIRLFYFADRLELEFHPAALRQVARSLSIVRILRDDQAANNLFLSLLTSSRDPARVLRAMSETGVLGRFIREFGKIVALMQFNRYHHYTVDEHLLRCIAHLSELEHGQSFENYPLALSILPKLNNERRTLYLAVFLHDIAKGRQEDHAVAGAKIARKLCPRFGLSDQETTTVAWLVEHHLSMSMTAQSRDLSDDKTICDFATFVQTMPRLNLLFILTICDIKAVGPKVWNDWKEKLLHDLYFATANVLTGGKSGETRGERAERLKHRLVAELADWPEHEREAYINRHRQNYWLTTSLDDQLVHASLIRSAQLGDTKIAVDTRLLGEKAIWTMTVVTKDRPKLLAIIAYACASTNTEIVDAKIFTTLDAIAVDTITIRRAFQLARDEQRRADRLANLIERLLADTSKLPRLSVKKTKDIIEPFTVEPRILIDNELSECFTVIEIEGMNRLGLLYDLTRTLADLLLNISSAHITTFGEKIIDSFYVTDMHGQKIRNHQQQQQLRSWLMAVLEPQREFL